MSRLKALAVSATASAAAILYVACGPEGSVPPLPVGPLDIVIEASTGNNVDGSAEGGPTGMPVGNSYIPVAEWTGPCQKAPGQIDVNLGNSPTAFVTAAYCQINGTMPSPTIVTNWVNQLATNAYLRRIDVVLSLCQQANNQCELQYSVPWEQTVLETDTCAHKGNRDVGAVMLFFFQCPLGLNCTMDWANTHAWGMDSFDQTYASPGTTTGAYNPNSVGFWQRELLDARHAGLQFILPNEYGTDTADLTFLEQALVAIDGMGGGIKVGLFDDTSAWGAGLGPAPSLTDTQAAATAIYQKQWQPFFKTITQSHWYTVKGTNKPLIYFYNAGTLQPASGMNAVLGAMKTMFMADFGVTPYVVLDTGYGTASSADGTFTWDTFKYASNNLGTWPGAGGLTLTTSMVKWDSLGRDSRGTISDGSAAQNIHKDTSILQSVLSATSSDDILVLETWNDLGEGTGITRNYDYYFNGAWQTPDVFLNLIRAAQCSN
jgi:hypothetical protein